MKLSLVSILTIVGLADTGAMWYQLWFSLISLGDMVVMTVQ